MRQNPTVCLRLRAGAERTSPRSLEPPKDTPLACLTATGRTEIEDIRTLGAGRRTAEPDQKEGER